MDLKTFLIRNYSRIAIILLILYVTVLFIRPDFPKDSYSLTSEYFSGNIGIFIMTIGLVMFLFFGYLSNSKINSYNSPNRYANLGEELKKQQEEYLSNYYKKDREKELLSEDEKNEIYTRLEKEVTKNMSNNILENIKNEYDKDIKYEKFLLSIYQHFESAKIRLLKEFELLSRRGNINLFIGLITTIIAIYILASTVLLDAKLTTDKAMIMYYIPRLTLSIFIEIFSFFFLRLYKSGLEDLKYYQNELTNIDMKLVAVNIAIEQNEKDSIKEVTSILATTERNFKLLKGESTVEIEKNKIDNDNMKSMFNTLKDFVKK